MNPAWLKTMRIDPIPALLGHDDQALIYFVRRDLLNEEVPKITILWEHPDAVRLVEKQREDGSWKYPGSTKKYESQQNYALLETYRNLRIVVEMYGFHREHSAIRNI
jgi:hypothetical protein